MTRHLTRLQELLENAWKFRDLPGSSDRYIIYICTLLSAVESAYVEGRGIQDPLESLIEELVPATGIPTSWIMAMRRHATAMLYV